MSTRPTMDAIVRVVCDLREGNDYLMWTLAAVAKLYAQYLDSKNGCATPRAPRRGHSRPVERPPTARPCCSTMEGAGSKLSEAMHGMHRSIDTQGARALRSLTHGVSAWPRAETARARPWSSQGARSCACAACSRRASTSLRENSPPQHPSATEGGG